MITLLKKVKQILLEGLTHYQQFRVNAENEYLAMSCGAFNPQLLAKIRRCKAGNNNAGNNKRKHTEK
jgi:hypothetical protein